MGNVCDWFTAQVRGTWLMSVLAIQVGGATVTGCDAHWLNQNCPSRTICASSTVGAVVAGAVAVALRSTDCPGAGAGGRGTRRCVGQAFESPLSSAGPPPARGAECTAGGGRMWPPARPGRD